MKTVITFSKVSLIASIMHTAIVYQSYIMHQRKNNSIINKHALINSTIHIQHNTIVSPCLYYALPAFILKSL